MFHFRQVGEVHVVESVRRNRVTGSLIGSDGSASMHGEHVELYSEEESSTGEEEEEEDEEEEEGTVEHGDNDTVQPTDSLESRPPTAGIYNTTNKMNARCCHRLRSVPVRLACFVFT